MQHDEIHGRFSYQPPQTMRHADDMEDVSIIIAAAAKEITAILPDGREKELVLTKLEEAQFWAHAAISRQRPEGGDER